MALLIDYHILESCAAADLDAAFARLSTDNYRELLAKHQGHSYTPPVPADDCVYDILTAERDAIMAHTLRSVADVEGAATSVVGVVGGLQTVSLD